MPRVLIIPVSDTDEVVVFLKIVTFPGSMVAAVENLEISTAVYKEEVGLVHLARKD